MKKIFVVALLIIFSLGLIYYGNVLNRVNDFSGSDAEAGDYQTIPITDMGVAGYKEFSGGLYAGGENEPPLFYKVSLQEQVEQIYPLDRNGNPSRDGKIVMLGLGSDHAANEFTALINHIKADASKMQLINKDLVLINGAQEDQDFVRWEKSALPWQEVSARLTAQNLSLNQVQVLWVKFPGSDKETVKRFSDFLTVAAQTYPNVRLIYLSSEIYAGYSSTQTFIEPAAYENGFVVQQLVNSSVNGEFQNSLDRDHPLLLWGPYLWTEGEKPSSTGLFWQRLDFNETGEFLSDQGKEKAAREMLSFFSTDPYSSPWFRQ